MRILSIFAGKSKTMENQQNQSKSTQKSTLLHVLCTVGGGVANSLNDASHLPHLAELFITLYYTCCELTEGSPRRNYTFTSSIRRAPSQPGIVRTRKRVKVGKCVKFKQITCTLVEINRFYIELYAYYMYKIFVGNAKFVFVSNIPPD